MRKVRLAVLGRSEDLLGQMELDLDAMEREYQSCTRRDESPPKPEGKLTGEFEVFRDGFWQAVNLAPMPKVRPKRRNRRR